MLASTQAHELGKLATGVARMRLEFKEDIKWVNAQIRWVLEALDDERSRHL